MCQGVGMFSSTVRQATKKMFTFLLSRDCLPACLPACLTCMRGLSAN